MNKILIIEDDLEINALLADFLKEKGYAVHCQYDGLHVLDFLNKEKIDLIILDIMLPYRSGDIISVSYTHLDVYKRQVLDRSSDKYKYCDRINISDYNNFSSYTCIIMCIGLVCCKTQSEIKK